MKRFIQSSGQAKSTLLSDSTPEYRRCLLEADCTTARSAASDAGNIKPSLALRRSGFARHLTKCACDGKQWSTHSAHSNHGWVSRIF